MVHCDSLTPKGMDLILQPPHQKQPPSSCTHSIEYAVSWSIAVASVENQIWLRWSILKIRFENHFIKFFWVTRWVSWNFMEFWWVTNPETSTILQCGRGRAWDRYHRTCGSPSSWDQLSFEFAQLASPSVRHWHGLNFCLSRVKTYQDNKISVSVRSELPRCPECLLRHVFAVIAFTANGSKEFVFSVYTCRIILYSCAFGQVMGLYPGDPGPPGADCAGTILELGERVRHLRTTRVWCRWTIVGRKTSVVLRQKSKLLNGKRFRRASALTSAFNSTPGPERMCLVKRLAA